MAIKVSSEILINATPQKIYSILTDFKDFPTWNPFITSIAGDLEVGKSLAVTISPPNSGKNSFKPKVLIVDKDKQISWLGILLFNGIFNGEHHLVLNDNGNGTTTFKQYENFTGILVPLFKTKLEVNTKKGFELMNEALKEEAEKN